MSRYRRRRYYRKHYNKHQDHIVLFFFLVVGAGILLQSLLAWYEENRIAGNILIALGIILLIRIAYTQIQIQKKKYTNPQTLSDLRAMDPFEFERFVAHQLKKNGCTEVTVTKKKQDGGYDVIAHKSNKIYVIQCKKYGDKHKVPVQVVREIYGIAKHIHPDAIPVILTTGLLTQPAYQEAKDYKVKIVDKFSIVEKLGLTN